METTIIKERSKMIQDLEKTFSLALEAGDYKAAIQAKQMICKMRGFFDNKDGSKQNLSLVELSQDELAMLIEEAEDLKKWDVKTECKTTHQA